MTALVRPFGLDFFCLGKKFLVYNLVSRNLKIKYRRSVFGVLWTLLSPLAMAGVYYFVFKVVLKVQMPSYLIFILSGVLPWGFFSQTFLEGMDSIASNWDLLSKIPIPLQVFPYVVAITNLVTLTLSLPILVGAAILSGVSLGPSLILIPVYFLCLMLITYSLSLITALLYVYFRDLKHLMGILVQIWFYATPVVYQESMIPERFHWILYANPLGAAFVGFHDIFVRGSWPTTESFSALLAWTAGSMLAAIIVHHKVSRGVVESI